MPRIEFREITTGNLKCDFCNKKATHILKIGDNKDKVFMTFCEKHFIKILNKLNPR